jgi:acyl-CoA reductase-like NAD-dependent aldehyde dehydrogenase
MTGTIPLSLERISIGVAVGILAYNASLVFAAMKASAALATGNTIVTPQ